jgi:hypothetical protein
LLVASQSAGDVYRYAIITELCSAYKYGGNKNRNAGDLVEHDFFYREVFCSKYGVPPRDVLHKAFCADTVFSVCNKDFLSGILISVAVIL